MKNNKDKGHSLPTEEEFLEYVPRRVDFEWKVNSEGLVEVKAPKFKSRFGKSFCRILRKDNYFTGNFDKLGSFIWQKCDGVNTVKDILGLVKKEFPDEKNIDQRLFLFLQQMENLCYMALYIKK
jgi:hypothetical protein